MQLAVRRGRPRCDAQRGINAARARGARLRAHRRRGVAEDRGGQPDRLLQGPRDDVRCLRRRPRRRAARSICASTGNTAASAAAYSARGGLRCAVIVPEGKIATGKLAQALMHGARVIALHGNFDDALRLVRELTERHPIALVNSVNEFRIEGQKTAAFELAERSTDGSMRSASPSATPATSPRTGVDSPSWDFGRGCSASRPRVPRRSSTGRPCAHPETSQARSGSAIPRAGKRRWMR